MELITEWSQHRCIKCKALYAMPKMVENEYRDTHETFYCPYCKQAHHYPQETDEERLKRQLKNVQYCCDQYEQKSERLELSRRALKGHVTRLKQKTA